MTENEKKEVLAAYLVAHPDWPAGPYEIDHLIPLELGGSNAASNLWPEPLAEAHHKDRVENYLKRAVCDGKMSLEEAQEAIITDWVKIYENLLQNH